MTEKRDSLYNLTSVQQRPQIPNGLGSSTVVFECRLVECEPDVGRWSLQQGDSFAVLASDGLWDVMSNQQAVDCAQVCIPDATAAASWFL